ncbi:GDP-fucose protein O-fucosyltransferase [Niveomyces insectorum RCEF 264]|uniref:GDP-fucose protein O-fucosyltransferase n=1 Tax=Niveomyces insectorum RCEF 264 TaxID=1081102 RepID=A0A167YWX3_9HYPO|nr:GDP-fucose protein O-fucosyltransferase [Niveomyces insectorum RCEF 264]
MESGRSQRAETSPWTRWLIKVSRVRTRYLVGITVLALFVLCNLALAGRFQRLVPHAALVTRPYSYGDLSQPDAPFIGWPLSRVCREASWMPGVVFKCDNNSGGIGNIRSFVLTCVRYAIEAGATGLVLPHIETRSESDLARLFGGQQPFDYFFDTQHFQTQLAAACPRIAVYDHVEAIPHLRDRRSEPLEPKTFGTRGGCDYRDLNRHTDLFGARFRDWLAASANTFGLPAVSLDHPRLLELVWGVQWEWPAWKDGPEFANTFGGLLRFRHDILALGRDTAAAMRRAAASAAASASSSSVGRHRGRGQYAGIHLRTENDALSFWPSYDTQADAYLARIAEQGLDWVYLATGNATEAKKLRDQAASSHGRGSGVHLVTKHDLLRDRPALLGQLEALTWDQQALVDYVVLLSCDYFLGVSPSTFSMSIAARRHLATSNEGIYTRPWKVGSEGGDGRSFLVGNYSAYWKDWLFMYDALWP